MVKLGLRDNFLYDPKFQPLPGIEFFPCEDEMHGVASAHILREDCISSRTCIKANIDLRLPQLYVISADSYVGRKVTLTMFMVFMIVGLIRGRCTGY